MLARGLESAMLILYLPLFEKSNNLNMLTLMKRDKSLA